MSILDFLNKDMIKPEIYGTFEQSWFQYLSVIFIIVFTTIVYKYFKNSSQQKIDRSLFITAIIMIILEIYKQVIFSYQNDWKYQWYAFPFQFCSVPMYLMLISSLSKNKNVKKAINLFLQTFSLFAGLAVMAYPETIFVTTIGINIQTVIHHGSMVVIGFSLLLNNVKLNLKDFYKAVIVFIIILFLAISLNYLYNLFINDGTFNMFFLNPMHENHLPVLQSIQSRVSFPMFVIVYACGFSFIGFLIYFFRYLFYNHSSKKLVAALSK